MLTIFKYPIPDKGNLAIIPVGFVPRHIALQDGRYCLWAEVDLKQRLATWEIARYATGSKIPEGAHYLGTVLEAEGAFVWHYYAVQA